MALVQLKRILANYSDLDALHVVSHANDGELLLGNGVITERSLKRDIKAFSVIDHALKDGADILFLGCDLAKSEKGEDFLELLSSEANIDVAASNNHTGSHALNGDWELEVVIGQVDSVLPWSKEALQDFAEVLAFSGSIDFSQVKSGGSSAGGAGDNAVVYTDVTKAYELISDGSLTSTYALSGYLYVDHASQFGGGTETQLTLSFFNNETFDATSLYLYNCSSVSKTFRIASDQGDSNYQLHQCK